MRQLVIVHNVDGQIVDAGIHDIGNVASYAAEGYLEYADGRLRPLVLTTTLYDVGQPWAADLLAWWRQGKYRVDVNTRDLVAVGGWQPPGSAPDETVATRAPATDTVVAHPAAAKTSPEQLRTAAESAGTVTAVRTVLRNLLGLLDER